MKKHVIILTIIALLLSGKTSRANDDTYRVALMVPLYLEQVTDEFCNEIPNNKMLLTKPFSFLQFYEGFMVAVDSMVNSRGLKLDLKVYDVDNDVNKAAVAIDDPWLSSADIIVGPFYLKPFEKVKEYASQHNIMIINPITQRSNIVDNQPNVVKIKPSLDSQMDYLDMLMRDYYHSNNVFIIRKNAIEDGKKIDKINEIAEKCMDSVTYVGNKHIVDVIKKHQRRWKYLRVDFEESEYLTDNMNLDVTILKGLIDDSTAFKNSIVNINYLRDSLHNVKNYASTLRNNLFIVYANDKVFANEIVNKVTKLTEYFPLTVVLLPEWSKFDGLFNENLMKMKAIYFDDKFIDYQSIRVMSFISKFREKYNTEPQEYAYQGFDIAWYFLNALKDKGRNLAEVLPAYEIPLLQSEFHFNKNSENGGFENTFWNIYQFKGYNKVIIKALEEKMGFDNESGGVFYNE